ncbi:MAG: hypothetical protein J6Q73_02615 [Bacteroidaceae bacterium]|nr:hypothetical protein [Bacteroidaceae bacterium]
MKKVIFTALMLAFSLAGTAQNENEKKGSVIENDDETVFIQPQKVTVKKGATTTVSITGESDGAEYTYDITSDENTKAIYKETDTSWDFSIPFVNKKNKSLGTQQRGRFIIDPTFGFGVIGATEKGGNVDLSFGNGSFEYILDRIVGFEYKTTRNSFVGLTFGLDWRNYKMIGNSRWAKDGDKTLITGYPDGADIDYSRLRTLSLTLSFMYGYNFNRYVNMKLGPVVSFNTRGNIKTCYNLNGETFKEKHKDINIVPVTVDFRAELNFRFVGLYFKYSPCNVLNSNFGPAFKPMSAGLLFGF